MLRFKSVLKLWYGEEHNYFFDPSKSEWVREDGLVSFKTLEILKLIRFNKIHLTYCDLSDPSIDKVSRSSLRSALKHCHYSTILKTA